MCSLYTAINGCSGRRQHQQKEDGRHTALLRKTTKDGGGGGSIKMSECGVDKHGVRSPLVNGSPATEPLMSGDGCSTSVNFGRPTWQPQLTPVDIPTTTTCSTFKKPPSPAVWRHTPLTGRRRKVVDSKLLPGPQRHTKTTSKFETFRMNDPFLTNALCCTSAIFLRRPVDVICAIFLYDNTDHIN